ncbi:galanin receptor 2a-like isoform X2 [Montipora foliosa]
MVYNRDITQTLFFAAVAILSFTGNLFFVVLFLRNKLLLKKAYHVILLILACTDMMTGIVLVLTPGYIIGEQAIFTTKNVGCAVFCYIIANQYLVFTLGIVSLYTVTLLAFERWFAVFRPLRYRTKFGSQNVRKYLLFVWLSSFAVNSTHIIETKFLFRGENTTQHRGCVFKQIAGKEVRVVIGILEICIKFIAPVIILLTTFIHLYHFMKNSTEGAPSRQTHVAVTRVTKMAALTSLVMVLCWFPNQLYYLLFKLNIVQLNTSWHRATVILCMFNSCLNPCIFLVSNKLYRQKAKELLICCGRLMTKQDMTLTDLRPASPQTVGILGVFKTRSMSIYREHGQEMISKAVKRFPELIKS